jgi:hypothetical protein
MAHTISRQFLTEEVRVRTQVSPCEIYGGQSGTGTDFSLRMPASGFPISCHSTSAASYHILYECKKLNDERKKLRGNIIRKGGTWPGNKMQLVEKFIKEYCKFINAIDLENF